MSRHNRNILVAAVFVSATISFSTRAGNLAADADSALQRFLNLECQVGEGGSLVDEILDYHDLLEPKFMALLHEGSDSMTVAKEQQSLEQAWARRQAFLGGNPNLGLGAEELGVVWGLSQESFMKRGMLRFLDLCRERAVIGLAAIGSPSAMEALLDLSNEGDEYTQDLVDAALRRYQPDGIDPSEGADDGADRHGRLGLAPRRHGRVPRK